MAASIVGTNNQSDVHTAVIAGQTTAVNRGVSSGAKEMSGKKLFVLMGQQIFGHWVDSVQSHGQSPRDSWNQGRSQAGKNGSSEGRRGTI